jgi:hypothetical protein
MLSDSIHETQVMDLGRRYPLSIDLSHFPGSSGKYALFKYQNIEISNSHLFSVGSCHWIN